MQSAWMQGRDLCDIRQTPLFALLLVMAACGGTSPDAADVEVDTTLPPVCSADADCAALDDGNACNGVIRCDTSGAAPICRLDQASIVRCDEAGDTACARNVCEPTTGACALKPEPKGTVCDDGDVCTSGDVCEAGLCKPGAGNVCGCKADSDCDDDGDLCNGVPQCDKATLPWTCRLKPKSAVDCDTSGDGPCELTACVVTSGACKTANRVDGSECDDGDACTSGDACEGGSCKATTNICTCNNDAGLGARRLWQRAVVPSS